METHQIDSMQNECLRTETPLFVLSGMGERLHAQRSIMNESQQRVQGMIEGQFNERMKRVMGYQHRRQ